MFSTFNVMGRASCRDTSFLTSDWKVLRRSHISLRSVIFSSHYAVSLSCLLVAQLTGFTLDSQERCSASDRSFFAWPAHPLGAVNKRIFRSVGGLWSIYHLQTLWAIKGRYCCSRPLIRFLSTLPPPHLAHRTLVLSNTHRAVLTPIFGKQCFIIVTELMFYQETFLELFF